MNEPYRPQDDQKAKLRSFKNIRQDSKRVYHAKTMRMRYLQHLRATQQQDPLLQLQDAGQEVAFFKTSTGL